LKKIPRWLNSVFSPVHFQNLDAAELLEALTNPAAARTWLTEMFDELKRLNLEVDRRLLSANDFRLTDLCARRQAIQYVLEALKSAKASVPAAKGPNPRIQVPEVDLDRVTV
jgi:hypothetical protein